MSSPSEFDPVRALTTLVAAGVDFVVIGGLALIAHGHVRTTEDLDIVCDADPDNLDRLGSVLVDLHAKLRGVDDDLPFVPDGRTLRRTGMLTLTTDAGWIDLLVDPAGAPRYPELRRAAEVIDLGGAPVPVASLAHLAAMKRAAGRPQDLADLDAIKTIRRLRAR